MAWEHGLVKKKTTHRRAGTSTSTTMEFLNINGQPFTNSQPFSSPSDGQPFTNPQAFSAPSVQVESLTLPELMKNQHVQMMYNQMMQGSQMQQKLWNENTRLNAQIQALHEKEQQTMYVLQHILSHTTY